MKGIVGIMEKQHGFTTRETWKEAFDAYFTKIRVIDKKNHELLNSSKDCDTWIQDFKRQSKEIRSLYLENDQFKQQHIYYFTKYPKHWTAQIADSLLACIFRYWSRMEDVEIIFGAAQALLTYYEALNDEISIMKVKLVIAYCYTYLDEVHYKKVALSLCQQVHELLEKHFDELNEEDLSMAMSIYDFQISIRYDCLTVEENFESFFDHVLYPEYKTIIAMYDRFIAKADMSLPINEIIPLMLRNTHRRFAEITLRIHEGELREDQLLLLRQIADGLFDKEDEDVNGQVEHMILHYMAHRFEYKYSNHELVEIFIDAVKILVVADNVTKQMDVKQLMETMECFSLALQTIGTENPECIYPAMFICKDYLQYLLKLPYSQGMIQIIDQTVYGYIIPLLKYVEDVNEVFDLLMNITIFRQIQTAIHSKMVGKSACLILEHIIDKKPELLYSLKGCSTKEDVLAHKQDILDFMQKAAMVHDVGKILCTRVINMQYRRITDVEFETIKFHPVSSSAILSSIPSMQKYHDIAVGHHKSFDGTFGYPLDFDSTKSKQKIFIDLIRICDSLDAATDTFGRLYAEPKSFQTVLKEFISLKKTSYSDTLIDFICEDEILQSELSELMSHGREAVYLEMHSFIMQKNKEG